MLESVECLQLPGEDGELWLTSVTFSKISALSEWQPFIPCSRPHDRQLCAVPETACTQLAEPRRTK